MGRESLAYRLQLWLTSPTIANYSAVGFMKLGFAITTFLLSIKTRFLSWPLYPVDYVLGVSTAEMVYIWVPVLISWLIKFAILRFGG